MREVGGGGRDRYRFEEGGELIKGLWCPRFYIKEGYARLDVRLCPCGMSHF